MDAKMKLQSEEKSIINDILVGVTKVTIEELWKNATPVRIANIDALMLAPENMLLHLCIHLPKHRYGRLIWLCDLSEIIRYNDIDWNRVLKNANKYKAKLYMYYGLYFTSKLLGANVPAYVLQKLKPNDLERNLFLLINKDIISGKKSVLSQITPLFKVLLIDRYLDRIRYLVEYFFPPIEMMEHRYGLSGSRIYFHRAAYPIYIIMKNFKRFAAMLLPPKM